MEWQAAASVAVAYFGQFLKAHKGFPTWAAQVLIVLAAFGLYFLTGPVATDWRGWVKDGIVWCLATLGVSSLSAGVKAAPKTDSIH